MGKTLDLGVIFKAGRDGPRFEFLPFVRCVHPAG